MFDYKTYCYIDGKLDWVVSSVKSWETRDEAIEIARAQAKCNCPLFGGEYEETEDGAKIWYNTNDWHRIHKIYKVC